MFSVYFSFLKLYNRDDVDLIGLDDAAARLGDLFLISIGFRFSISGI